MTLFEILAGWQLHCFELITLLARPINSQPELRDSRSYSSLDEVKKVGGDFELLQTEFAQLQEKYNSLEKDQSRRIAETGLPKHSIRWITFTFLQATLIEEKELLKQDTQDMDRVITEQAFLLQQSKTECESLKQNLEKVELLLRQSQMEKAVKPDKRGQ